MGSTTSRSVRARPSKSKRKIAQVGMGLASLWWVQSSPKARGTCIMATLAVSHSVAMMQVPRAFGDDWTRHSDARPMPNCAIFRFDFDGRDLALREVVDPMA